MPSHVGRDGKESHVFFATPEIQGASFQDPKNPDMPWELGQLVHKKQFRVYQLTLYMDGVTDTRARKCSGPTKPHVMSAVQTAKESTCWLSMLSRTMGKLSPG